MNSVTTYQITAVIIASACVLAGCGDPSMNLTHTVELSAIKTIAVVPFVDAPGSEGSGEVVVTAAMQQLYRTPGVRVVERRRLKAIIDEHDLMQALSTDAQVASKIGEITGADTVILGEVTQYEAQQESGFVAVSAISGGGTKHIHRVGLSVRAVNVRDGQIIYAELGQGVNKGGYSDAAKQASQRAFRPWTAFFQQRERARVRAEARAQAQAEAQARADARADAKAKAQAKAQAEAAAAAAAAATGS